MSRQNRVIVLATIVVVAIVAFVALRPGDDNTPARGGEATSPTATAGASSTKAPAVARAPITITVRGGAPVGGVRKIAAKQGTKVGFVVRADAAEEVHLHGYDIKHDVAPDAPARFTFSASIPGVFEAELEGAGRQIVELTVTP